MIVPHVSPGGFSTAHCRSVLSHSLQKYNRSGILAVFAGMLCLVMISCSDGERASVQQEPVKTIAWNRDTLVLVAPGGGYGRMIRINDGRILCTCERDRMSWVTTSTDEGRTWSEPWVAPP